MKVRHDWRVHPVDCRACQLGGTVRGHYVFGRRYLQDEYAKTLTKELKTKGKRKKRKKKRRKHAD